MAHVEGAYAACPWQRCRDARVLRRDPSPGNARGPRIWQICSCQVREYPVNYKAPLSVKGPAPMAGTRGREGSLPPPPPSKPAQCKPVPAVAAVLPFDLGIFDDDSRQPVDRARDYWNSDRRAELTAPPPLPPPVKAPTTPPDAVERHEMVSVKTPPWEVAKRLGLEDLFQEGSYPPSSWTPTQFFAPPGPDQPPMAAPTGAESSTRTGGGLLSGAEISCLSYPARRVASTPRWLLEDFGPPGGKSDAQGRHKQSKAPAKSGQRPLGPPKAKAARTEEQAKATADARREAFGATQMWATPPSSSSPDPIVWTQQAPQPQKGSSTQWLGQGNVTVRQDAEQHETRRRLLLEFFKPPISPSHRENMVVKTLVEAANFLPIREAVTVKVLSAKVKAQWARALGQQLESFLQLERVGTAEQKK